MSRRKQSNPKPIKHDDDGDEMDGGDCRTIGNSSSLSSTATSREDNRSVWSRISHTSKEPNGLKENNFVASIGSLKLSDTKLHLGDTDSNLIDKIFPSQDRKDKLREYSENSLILNKKNTSLNRSNQEKEENAEKVSICADEEGTLVTCNGNVFLASTRSISPSLQENDIAESDMRFSSKTKQIDECDPHKVHDRETVSVIDSASKSQAESTSPHETLNSHNAHNDDHEMSPQAEHTERVLSECQVPNKTADSIEDASKDTIHDNSRNDASPKPSPMARFPIIPNGKSFTSSSRSIGQHRHGLSVDHSGTNKTSGSEANLPAITSSDPRGSPEASPHCTGLNKPLSPRDASPPLSPGTIKANSSRLRSQEEAELALVNQLQLPSDVLYLRQQEVHIHGTPNVGWVVCSAIPLPQGSSLGPFQGQLVAPEDVKVGDLIVQFTNKKGQQALMNVAEQSGGWLALLRTPQAPSQRNTHVYWEGGRIWCEIVSDIEMGAELRASFSFQNEEEDEEEEPEAKQSGGVTEHKGACLDSASPLQKDSAGSAHEEMKIEAMSSESDKSSPREGVFGASSACVQRPQLQQLPPHPNQQQPAPGHAALIYGCPFCGVRFSSPRTLQGHLSFYCSKKTSDSRLYNTSTSGGAKTKGGNQVKPDDCDTKRGPSERSSSNERSGLKRRASDLNDTETASDNNVRISFSSPPPTKVSCSRYTPSHRSGETLDHDGESENFNQRDQSPCTTDKLSHMSKHKSIQDNGSAPSTSVRIHDYTEKTNIPFSHADRHPASLLKFPSSETFCKECKIQFSSMRTYKCHKEHYCAQRRKKALADPSPFAAMFNSPFPFSTDNANVNSGIPSALQMSALSQRGLILPGQGSQVAAAAAAMILQANMAAMSLPGVLMRQRDSVPAASPQLRSPIPTSSYSLQQSSRGDSPDGHHPKQQHSLSKEKQEPHADQISISSSLTPYKDYMSKTASPETSKESEILYQKERSRSFHAEHRKDKERNLSQEPGSETLAGDEDHPLDLSVAKTEYKQQEQAGCLSPNLHNNHNNDLTFKQSSPSSSSTPRSLKTESALSPRSAQIHLHGSGQSSGDINPSIAILRPGLLSPGSAQAHLLAHHGNPSLLLRPPGFLAAPRTTSPSHPALNISPLGRRHRPDSPSALAKNISKCLDCNIVFYKHDNYLIHKKHYCSGKRRSALSTSRSMSPESPPTHPGQIVPLSPQRIASSSRSPQKQIDTSPATSSVSVKVSHSPQPRESSNSPPKQPIGSVKYKFYCVPCKIKFSNASILEAHKEYYCPAGKDSEHSVILQASTSAESGSHLDPGTFLSPNEDSDVYSRELNSSPEPQHEEVTCNRCNSVFTSARLLRLHVCDGGFPCPHCDHVAITENRLAEHLKVHAPTRAYRCTICGYRGNTARGMRMHGKTHIDEGLDFTDENMLEYEEPAVMPILSHATVSGLAGAAATDTELLRLKNEPYKRRRSRKAYEKFDYPLPKVDIPQTCPLCGQNFANADFLASHFKVHQIAASQYLAGLMKCIHCSYVGKSPEDLRAHFEASHASNHRIHLPQRVSPSQATRGRRDEMIFLENNIDARSIAEEKMDQNENSSPQEPQTHMVITDPNSPLNENDVSTIDKEHNVDQKESQHSPSPFPVRIKEELMESEELASKSNGSVDHFLHMPQVNSVENTERHHSPPVRNLSVSPSVFLRRRQTPERSEQRESRHLGTTGESRSKDFSPEIFIKKEPSSGVNEATLATRTDACSSSLLSQNKETAAVNSESPTVLVSPAPVAHSAKNDSQENATNDQPQFLKRSEEDNAVTLSKSSLVSPSPSASVTQPVIVQIKQEQEQSNNERPNFLSSPGSRKDETGKPQDISTSSSSLPGQRSHHVSPDSQPHMYARDRTVSPSSSRAQMSPRQTSTLAASAVPPDSLTTAFPPQSLLHHPSLTFPYPNPQTLPFIFLPGHAPIGGPHQAFPMSAREDRGNRYCQNCDISFSKQATYLAHKKYYCTARPRGEPQPSATA